MENKQKDMMEDKQKQENDKRAGGRDKEAVTYLNIVPRQTHGTKEKKNKPSDQLK